MNLYRTLSDENIWRAVVCESTAEAEQILGRYPDIIPHNGSGRNESTERMWASPRTLFIKNFDVFPAVWEPAPPEAREQGKDQDSTWRHWPLRAPAKK